MGRADTARLHLRRAGLVTLHRGAHLARLALAGSPERGSRPVAGPAPPLSGPSVSRRRSDECWARFEHALRPLHQAGKLGVVVLQYPGWFGPRDRRPGRSWRRSRTRLPDYRLAVELRNPKWFEGDACEGTLEGLEECGLALVCMDGPAGGPRASPAWRQRPRTWPSSVSLAAARSRASPGLLRTAIPRMSCGPGCHDSASWRHRLSGPCPARQLLGVRRGRQCRRAGGSSSGWRTSPARRRRSRDRSRGRPRRMRHGPG